MPPDHPDPSPTDDLHARNLAAQRAPLNSDAACSERAAYAQTIRNFGRSPRHATA